MRTFLTPAIVLLTLTLSTPGQEATSPGEGAMVAHRYWVDYSRRHCTDSKVILESVLADDYTFVAGVTGEVLTRAEFLKAAPCDEGWRSKSEDESVRVYSGVVVITGLLRVETVEGRRPKYTSLTRYTNVYVKGPKRWQLAHTHFTRLSDN